MKRNTTLGVLLAVGLGLTFVGCGADSSDTAASSRRPEAAGSSFADSPPLRFASRTVEAVQGNVVTLDFAVGDVRLVAADGDTSGRTGHLHVFVDRPVPEPGSAIPKEPGIIHTTETRVVIDGLSVGPHRFSAVLGDGAHRRIGDAMVSAEVMVQGPSVAVSAPPTFPNGEPVSVEVSVEGASLVAADGDRSGHTGHLHLFVDRPPTPAGQVIPKDDSIIHTTETKVSLPGLAPGEHTVWVVLGDGVHMPLVPPVVAKTTFTVQG